MGELQTEWIEEGNREGLEAARGFALEKILDRAPLYASLSCPPVRKRSRLLILRRGSQIEGLAAVVEGVFPFRSVPVSALYPGAARALLCEIEPPFVALATQPTWADLARCGGQPILEEMQMARMRRTPVPEPDPSLERLKGADELEELLGPRFSPVHLEAGLFLGIRDRKGRLVACGGVHFVTDRIAQIAYIETREERRRAGLGKAVLSGLIRELETDRRILVLQVRRDNVAAIELYGRFGFRGRVRTALYAFNQPVLPVQRPAEETRPTR